ncbi:MAG: hypothetical protein MJ211_04675 [Bacteroidales bacterium]|nr:hypothetical protein [Bacteroidales bacterium]
MKKIFILILGFVMPFIASAQMVTPQQATADDYIAMLHAGGYESYPFTIPAKYLKKTATFQVKEFENHKEVAPENSFQIVFDIETERLRINFYPQEGDSLRRCVGQWDATIPFILKNKFVIKDDDYGPEPYYFYSVVSQNKDIKFEVGKFIPLVLYGSGYQITDKHTGKHYYKFCGDFDDLVEMSPHYYLIGITILK